MKGITEQEARSRDAVLAKLKNQPLELNLFHDKLVASGKSYLTVTKYIDDLIAFELFITGGTIEEDFYKGVTPADIERYMEATKTRRNNQGKIVDVSDETRATKWSAINAFFQFLKERGRIEENPAEKTERPKQKRHQTVSYLTKEEIVKIMQRIRSDADDKFVNRDLCVFSLAVTAGLRLREISMINTDDVDFKTNTITIYKRGSKERTVSFGNNLKRYLQMWVKDRMFYFSDANTDALFVSQKKERLSIYRIRGIIKEYAEAAIGKDITPRDLRASCAVTVYEETKNLSLVADIADVVPTSAARYAQAADDKEKLAAVQFMDELL